MRISTLLVSLVSVFSVGANCLLVHRVSDPLALRLAKEKANSPAEAPAGQAYAFLEAAPDHGTPCADGGCSFLDSTSRKSKKDKQKKKIKKLKKKIKKAEKKCRENHTEEECKLVKEEAAYEALKQLNEGGSPGEEVPQGRAD